MAKKKRTGMGNEVKKMEQGAAQKPGKARETVRISLKGAALLALTLVLGVAVYYAYSELNKPEYAQYKYYYREGVIELFSDDGPPLELLKGLAGRGKVVIVGKKPLESNDSIGGITRAFIILSAVATANNAQSTVLIEEYSSKGELGTCYTNQGSADVAIAVTAEDCASFKNQATLDPESAVITFERPEPGNETVKAYVGYGGVRIVLRSNDFVLGKSNEIEAMTWFVAQTIYPNAREVVEKVNKLTQSIQAS